MASNSHDDWTYIEDDTLSREATRQQKSSRDETYAVTADLLIPGRGAPIENAGIVVSGTKIKHVCHIKDLVKSFGHLLTTHVKILMPGMWDCHVHLMGEHKVSSDAFIDAWKNPVLAGARSARDVMLLLDAGFTSVREMAGYGLQLDQAIR